MKHTTITLTIGATAAAVGFSIGYFLSRKAEQRRCAQRVHEEVRAIRKEFQRRLPQETEAPAKESEGADATRHSGRYPWGSGEDPHPHGDDTLAQLASALGYRETADTGEASPSMVVISPDEFGEEDEYDQCSLFQYADGVIADSDDHALSDDEIEERIGKDSLQHFGEYEDDSLYVRNERTKTYYEILYDPRTYAEMLTKKPYLKE